jgi:uncharacterized protein (DUF927 family)
MNKEEMIEVIFNYKDELQNDYNELCKAFGQQDPATKRNETKLVTMLLLLDKLELNEY